MWWQRMCVWLWVVVEGLQVVVAENRCWTMVEEGKTGPWLTNAATKDILVAIFLSHGPVLSSSTMA